MSVPAQSYEEWRAHVEEHPDELCRERERHCWPLLTDTAAVLADKSRWPDHLCGDVIEVALSTWADERAWRILGNRWPNVSKQWRNTVPLPIGYFALASLGRSVSPPPSPFSMMIDGPHLGMYQLLYGASDEDREVRKLATFPFTEKAMFIREVSLGLSSVTFYCVVDNHPTVKVQTGRDWMPSDIKFAVTGYPLDEDVQALCRNATAWWEWLIGRRLAAAGRPAGSVGWPLFRIKRLVLEYAADTGDRAPTKERFLSWSREPGREGPAKNTLDARLKETGQTWLQWTRSVLGSS